MKVLIADKLAAFVKDNLEKESFEVIQNASLKAEDLPAHIKEVDILIVRSTKVNAQTIQAADKLSLIIRAGAGVNTIDLQTAGKRGIFVSNCPGKNTEAVAELALGLILAADRRIVAACNDLRSGKWNKKEYGKAGGLKGRTLGIAGFGAIGQALSKRARALEMNITAWSRSLTEDKAKEEDVKLAKSLNQLATVSDVVSIHLPLNAQTKHIIGKDFFAAMKKGSIFVNTSRGDIVDTEALRQAIQEKGIKAALDVFENEPAGGQAEFLQTDFAKLLSCTPHIGASTEQASEATAGEVLRIIEAYVKTGKPLNAVNKKEKSTAKYNLVIRHYNKVGVLASVLDELRNQDVNIEEMENLIFEGGEAASCTLKLDSLPTDEVLTKLEKNEFIIQLSLK